MLPLVILSVALAPANSSESPAELAAWIDARLEANWRAKGLPSRPVAEDMEEGGKVFVAMYVPLKRHAACSPPSSTHRSAEDVLSVSRLVYRS